MLLYIWLNISCGSSFILLSYNNLNYIFRCTQFCQNSNHWLESLFMVIVFSTYLHVHWLWIWEQRYNQIICLLISFIVGSGGQRSGPPTAFVSLFIIRMPLYFSPFFFLVEMVFYFAGKNLGDSQPNAARELFECGWLILQQCRVR